MRVGGGGVSCLHSDQTPQDQDRVLDSKDYCEVGGRSRQAHNLESSSTNRLPCTAIRPCKIKTEY